jgi:hypothetical protein
MPLSFEFFESWHATYFYRRRRSTSGHRFAALATPKRFAYGAFVKFKSHTEKEL